MSSSKVKIIILLKNAKKCLVNFFIRFFQTGKNNGFDSRQTVWDKKLVSSLGKSKWPSLKQIKYIGRFLSPLELRLVWGCLAIIFLSLAFCGWQFYKNHLQTVPVVSGEYIEGLVGAPKYINPIYAGASDADSDISYLVFSSLFKRGGDGRLVNDLADNCTLGAENKIYTCTVRTDARWHNGEDLTVDDIIFTFNAIKNTQYKSPLRPSFVGVDIEKVDARTIRFILAEPYAAFPELLTFGIIPQNLWLQVAPEAASLADLNLRPIGSGPYKFKSLTKDKAGNIRSYSLEINENYYGSRPYIKNLTFKFFPGFEELINALNENNIEGVSYLPHYAQDSLIAKDSLAFYKLNFPQLTAIFLNQKNNPALSDVKVRQALALAINKNEIVSQIFGGDARLVDGPILPESFAYNQDITKYRFNKEEAEKLLAEAGWTKEEITAEQLAQAEVDFDSEDEAVKQAAENTLSLGAGQWLKKDGNYFVIILTIVETDDNIKVADLVKTFWEAVGVKTIVNIVPAAQIQSDIIKPRNFQALFYGQVVGSDPDAYAFWHSSQIGESGLNIANYANKEVDQLLEDARLTSDMETRVAKYQEFQKIFTEEVPAIFMYSPIYTYVQSKKIKGFDVSSILTPRDRFANISQWYIKTGQKLVW